MGKGKGVRGSAGKGTSSGKRATRLPNVAVPALESSGPGHRGNRSLSGLNALIGDYLLEPMRKALKRQERNQQRMLNEMARDAHHRQCNIERGISPKSYYRRQEELRNENNT